MLQIYFILFLLNQSVFSLEEDDSTPNNVVGQPFVSCAADAIYIKFKTNVTFDGHVSVKYTPNQYCYQVLVTNNQIELLIPHEECSVSRRRSLNPRGVVMDVTMSVSFHREFTTSNDKIFHFNCFHLQKNESGSSTLPPAELHAGPRCQYNILQSPGGRAVGTVSMGQTVYHEWTCDHATDSCLIVRNCALVAGQSRHNLIGQDGCSKDQTILPNLVYRNQTYISQNVSVFGVSTASLVYFECEILLIPSFEDDQCQIPNCQTENDRKKRSKEIQSDAVMEVRSQRIEISELDPIAEEDPVELTKCEESQPQVSQSEELCVSLSTFAITLSLIVCIALFVVLIASIALLQRYKYYNVANNSS
ncbi:unnamed protein product [Auanema sp. JU1783]|nr:unnamed protein product [Auanema sp. JU1783]